MAAKPYLFLGLYAPGIFDNTAVAQYYNLVDASYADQPGTNPTTMQLSVAKMIAAINQTTGPFALAGMSYGAWVISNVLDEIRSGSLQSRQADFLGGVAAGNPAREGGHTLPGVTGAIDPGGHGILDANQRLVNTPSTWYEFAAAGDLIAVNGDDANGEIVTGIFDYLYNNPTAGQQDLNTAIAMYESASFSWQTITDLWNLISDGMTWIVQHLSYTSYPPITGDARNCIEVAADHLVSLATTAGSTSSPIPASMTPTITKRYPAGPITPAGAYYLLNNKLPNMAYRGYDDTTVFNLMGGMAIYDRMAPESVQVVDMKGLVPPWQKISQKGATQDGETFVTSLYDPIEVDITVRIRGRDAAYSRRVLRDWIASWDAIKPGELSFTDMDIGRWWAPVRWSERPTDKWTGGTELPQELMWRAIAYDAFWRTYDSVDSFEFQYSAGSDEFDYTTTEGLTGWTLHYSNDGGWIYASNDLDVLGIHIDVPGGGMAQWVFDPDNPVGQTPTDSVAINNTFVSATDDQVVTIRLGTMPGWVFVDQAYNDIWLRTPDPASKTPGTEGLRLRIGFNVVTLSYFIGGVETVIRSQPLTIPPVPGEFWKLVCTGRSYTITRGGVIGSSTVMNVVENSTGSPIGPNNRHAGFGMHSDYLAAPATVMSWSAGDNNVEAQSGDITLFNPGDQTMFWRATVYGPGDFYLGDGPDAGEADFVHMGTLLDNQIAQLRTDPRKRGVTDLTVIPNSPQALTNYQKGLEDFLSFAVGNNTSPLVQSIESQAGIVPPQGNIYSLLDGRFSDAAGIPPVSPGGEVQPYKIPVRIENGNANSRIVIAGTPLRRFPY